MECLPILCLFVLVNPVFGWQFFTNFRDLTMSGTGLEAKHIHSEYVYGDCRRKDLVFYTHVHIDHMQILGKLIIRGWIEALRIPTCIFLRAMSYEYDLFRSTAYNFQICVPRITYCHSRKRWKYFYYEWYIPMDMVGGMDWDIYFYGPPNLTWQ
ncbi:hypothetical protein ABMA27_006646 [Loxostege sticticalis]|uniref:Uncharacterized protein n=1 Tax=Loxostege sticticalis TaxID=481309 RepID=A0ABR3IJV2_LOXSC